MGAHRGVTPLETSTTTSFTTSSLSDPFPLVSHEQYATLERVVAALPLGARNWADFEETYKLLGVDEDEYYPLCLKLTFERGHDWREKWSTAKASLEERGVTFAADVQGRQAVEPSSSRKSARGFDLLKAKVDQVTTTAPSSRRPLPAAAPATTPRAAYPSRTRSTPHNDPTPRASRPTRPFLVETANGNSSSDDYVGVPSSAPRTTPRHRDEHTAPILPQAPAQRSPLLSTTATARREKHSSLPPLPSDSSPRLPTHTRTTSSHPLLSQRINSVTPVAPSAPFAPPPTPYSVALPTPLEQRAIAFRRVSLLSLSWYNWRQRLAFLRTRSENLDAARRVVLARWVVVWWREKLARVQQLESLVEKVVRERQGAVKRGAFAVWKGKVEERRRAEWEAGLRGAWEIVRGKWKEKARRECFQVCIELKECASW